MTLVEDIALRYIGSYHDQEYNAIIDIRRNKRMFFDSDSRMKKWTKKPTGLTLESTQYPLDWV